MTFDATVNPVVYEGGVPIFIDTEYDTWNMDPVALEKAFELYPDVKVVVIAHLYGTPGKVEKLKEILAEQLDVDANSITRESLLIEDLGADSLDAIDIVMSVEDEFKLEVPDEIIEKIETVGDILNFIENNI